jgi:hypothetical protein
MEEARAVMKNLMEGILAKSTDYWDVVESQDTITMGKGQHIAFTLEATGTKMKISIHRKTLERHLKPEEEDTQHFQNGLRLRMVRLGLTGEIGVVYVGGSWEHKFSPANYEGRKKYVLKLMVIALVGTLEIMGV